MWEVENLSNRLVELGLPWDLPAEPMERATGVEAAIQQRLARVKEQAAAVFAVCDQQADAAVAFLQDLVRIESVNPSPDFEQPLADFLLQHTAGLGMVNQRLEPFPKRVSFVSTLAGAGAGPTLLFNGHLDTVPAGDLKLWRYPPFAAAIHDGRIYGRGSKDCKEGVAAAVMAAQALVSAGVKLKGNFAVSATADEETGGHLGLHELIKAGLIKADWAVYLEGVPDIVRIGHPGCVSFKLAVKGKAAHMGRKEQGVNAIVKAARVIAALEGLAFTGWQPHPHVPGTVNCTITQVSGGSSAAMVPGRCEIEAWINLIPPIRPESVMAQVQACLDGLLAADPELALEGPELLAVWRPCHVSPQEPLIAYVQAAAREVLGIVPKVEGMKPASDTRWLVLDARIPTVMYALGNATNHMPNEYVDIADYLKNIKIYCLLALLLLGQA